MRYYLAALAAALMFGIPWLAMNDPAGVAAVADGIRRAGGEIAAVILSHNPVTVAQLQSSYASAGADTSQPRVKILVVPGHEPHYGGAVYDSPLFGTMKERDFTVDLGRYLSGYLSSDTRYDISTTRTKDAWTPTFADYFKNDWNDIVSWEQANKSQFEAQVAAGDVRVATDTPPHMDAPTDVALRLYGIDKWANDNGVSLMVHIHFNDYPGHGTHEGKYDGFAIYVPADDYGNSTTTDTIAKDVFARLSKYNPVSDWPQEAAGIVHDQTLIATGSFDTVNAPSMLIEYSYLYEPQLDDPATQQLFLKDLAYETYLGIEDFFNPGGASSPGGFGTAELPHTWNAPMSSGPDTTADIFALQTALMYDGDYPPAGETMNSCPRTGKFGPCTKEAVLAFQQKYGIAGANGNVGPATLAKLNQLFGQ